MLVAGPHKGTGWASGCSNFQCKQLRPHKKVASPELLTKNPILGDLEHYGWNPQFNNWVDYTFD